MEKKCCWISKVTCSTEDRNQNTPSLYELRRLLIQSAWARVPLLHFQWEGRAWQMNRLMSLCSTAADGIQGCYNYGLLEIKGGAGELRERQGPAMSGLGTSADSWLPDAYQRCVHASSDWEGRATSQTDWANLIYSGGWILAQQINKHIHFTMVGGFGGH